MPGKIQAAGGFVLFLVVIAAIILCIIRQKKRLQRDGLISTIIDTCVVFLGGGNLQMRYKLEKWFFGILLIGAFFVTALWSGDLLECIIRIRNQKISTFNGLTGTNSPIYIPNTLTTHNAHIYEMLKFVSN